MAISLTVWTCDSCAGDITDPGTGIVTYRCDEQRRAYDFRLVHKNIDGRRCDPGFVYSIELYSLLGPAGLADLLSFLSAGPLSGRRGEVRVADFDGYVDVIRRLHTPGYEQARPFWHTEHTRQLIDGANHTNPYLPDTLEQIATQNAQG